MKQPKWLDTALFYEIYPQSFKDTNSDGIGDFNGIIEKLDYIKSLGCNAIWMNPCFESPFYDAGYDIADYYKIAPRYGTNDDAKRLFKEVHDRGMHILLDLVPGHTSILHPWFKESQKFEKNPYTDRYVWSDNIWGGKGMTFLSGISERYGAVAVNFFAHQPSLNYGYYEKTESWQQDMEDEGPRSSREEMLNIMRFWLKMGCDGFRVDMAHSMIKGDPDQKGTVAFWNIVRDTLDKEFDQYALISEWGEPDKALQGGFHMDFLLHFGPSHYNDLFRCDEPFFSKRGKGEIKAFIDKYNENLEKSGGKGMICIPSGNHDMIRLAKYLDSDEIKLAFAFLLSMPGAPFIYYGDEIGMSYVENLPSVEGGYERTGSRSPMQWDSTPNSGFSCAYKDKMYIKMDPSEDRPTVEDQLQDDSSILNEIKRLVTTRKAHSALENTASIDFLTDTYPLCYRRKSSDESILVIINPSDKEVKIPVEINGEIIYYLGGLCQNTVSDGQKITVTGSNITIDPATAIFIRE